MNRRQFLQSSALTGRAALALGQSISSPASLTAAPVRLPDLKPAEWIWYPSGRCLANTFVLFRRELQLAAKPRRATGWVVADSRYRLEVNGRRIQWGPAPCDPRWAEADPLDLTEALQAGNNAIGATALFFGHGDGTWPAGKPGFLFWLEIEHGGGEKTTIVSDKTWQAMLCRAWKPGQYKRWFLRALQEEFDARLFPYGWSEPGFDVGAEWLPAMQIGGSPNRPSIMTNYVEYATGVRTGPPSSELLPRSVPMLDEPVVAAKGLAEADWIYWLRLPEEYFECRTPDSFRAAHGPSAVETSPGRWEAKLDGKRAAALTFEFNEQIVGWPFFTIEAPAGTIVELMSQEGHEVGRPALMNTHFDNWTRFTCKEGVNRFECFDFESLRWVQLHVRNGLGAISISDVGVRRRIYPWPNQPVIRTSEPQLQRLFDASINTLHNCAQDTLVDGMGRERQPYSGDCGHQLIAVRLAFGETRSPARFLRTFSQGQTEEDYFLDCWPAYDRLARLWERELGLFHLGPILDHGVQLNFDCWKHYQFTGDLAIVKELYPRFKRFAHYLQGLAGRDGDDLLPVENLGTPCVWMDYQAYQQVSGLAPEFTQRHKQCSFNLYTAAMFEHALAPMSRACGDDASAEELTKLSRRLVAATVRKFWSRERRNFVNNLPWLAEEKKITMCDRSLATAVLFDQCPGGDTAAAVRTLVECPREMGFSYTCNAGWRLWALAKAGRSETVVKDFRQRWATMESVKWNNSLQEQWRVRPDTPSQWSHCPVAPLYILYEGLVGLRPLSPGFRRAEFRPQLADLGDLELVAHTPQGPLRFTAKGRAGDRQVTIDLPSGCEGELALPGEEQAPLEPIGVEAAGLRRYRLPAGRATAIKLAHS